MNRYFLLMLALTLSLNSCDKDEFDCEVLNASFGDECMDDQDNVGQVGLSCDCESRELDISVDVNNPALITLGITENSHLDFFVASSMSGFSAFVNVQAGMEVLDSLGSGYPLALDAGDNISDNNFWSSDNNLILGTVASDWGNFSGAGEKYLGFRIKDNDDFYYGWITITVDSDNSQVFIGNYWINYDPNVFIEAGEK